MNPSFKPLRRICMFCAALGVIQLGRVCWLFQMQSVRNSELIAAVKRSNEPEVARLLSCGVDPNALDYRGSTSTHFSLSMKYLKSFWRRSADASSARPRAANDLDS